MANVKKIDQVKVYVEFVNYLGEVNDSAEVASFRNIVWATPFLKNLLILVKNEPDIVRYRIQFADGKKAYVTKHGDNEFVRNLI